MERIIKFRIWCSSLNTWMYINMNQTISEAVAKIYNMEIINGHQPYLFTGLHDKDGKEIYEGDIFKIERMSIQLYEVRYTDGIENNYEWYGATFILHKNDGYTEVAFPFDATAMQFGEVIGNIYENPELLK